MKKVVAFLVAGVLAVSLVPPAMANTFTDSVEQKGSPSLAVTKGENGISVSIAVVENENMDNVEDLIPVEAVSVTSVANLEKAPAKVQEEMTQAYNSIAEAGSLVKAVPEFEKVVEDQIQKMLDIAADAGKNADALKNVKAENLIVRDLIYIDLQEDYVAQLAENQAVRLCFDLKLEEDAFLMVMVFVDNEWVIVPANDVRVLPTGEVLIALDAFGPVAFVVEKGE